MNGAQLKVEVTNHPSQMLFAVAWHIPYACQGNSQSFFYLFVVWVFLHNVCVYESDCELNTYRVTV